jgi:hypothetical protein
VKLVDHSALEANPEETEKQYIVMPLAAGGELQFFVYRKAVLSPGGAKPKAGVIVRLEVREAPGSFRIGYALERELSEKYSRANPNAQDMGLATLAEIVANPFTSFSVNARHG